MTFKDRREAGQKLAEVLVEKKFLNPLVICLPRGGVPVGVEIAKELGCDCDVLIVRKLGAPQNPEFAIGAVSEGHVSLLHQESIVELGIEDEALKQIIENEQAELQRRIKKFRGSRPLKDVKNRTILLVDDGLATGATAAVAADYLHIVGAKDVVLCVPVSSRPGKKFLEEHVDQVIALEQPEDFDYVGKWYDAFPQLSDEQVTSILGKFVSNRSIIDEISERAHTFSSPVDLGPLIEKIKDSKVVMLGESSHGTHEYYKWRDLISRELIEKHGFNFIAVEGDWPPCMAITNYIESEGDEPVEKVLGQFGRWPTWMWANTEVAAHINWLKSWNQKTEKKVGFYGLDVYSLFESIEAAVAQLEKINPELARKIKSQYDCFERYSKDEMKYIKSLVQSFEGCESQVIQSLNELLSTRMSELEQKEELFDATQNARIIKNAEKYYRAMISANDDSWNVRDRHMMETLEVLLNHYGPDSKGIVWAHNTHIGDYQATDMIHQGDINIGGLAREKLGLDQVSLVGFGSHRGTVIASSAWGGAIKKMSVPPAISGSYEDFFHQAAKRMKKDEFYILLEEDSQSHLGERKGHRAIGVVYAPTHERGNYVPSILNERYDAFVYFDETTALHPLGIKSERHDFPDTFPTGV